ncbi:MAG: hypothetical protein JWN51_1372 [Phycisphaerales bacterium]|nr:hypothetical protein [Phycisphaerales bacterium]
MFARRLILTAAVTVAVSASLPSRMLRAEDAAPQDVETGKHSFIGQINANNVIVRSAPREDAYPTLRLEKGTKVTVVGLKFKWLKIVPPEGSFAYVPQAYITRRGDGKTGRADREILARTGSALNPLKTNTMGKVEAGQDVEILGVQDEYYKIKPPEGSYVYVNENLVEAVKALPTVAQQKAGQLANGEPDATLPDHSATPGDLNHKGPGPLISETPTTQRAVAEGPTTQPGSADAITTATAAFDKLEEDFKASNEKLIVEQPIDTLLAGYNDLLKQDALPTSMRRLSETRIATLKLRGEAKADFMAHLEAQAKAAERTKALTAEREEIAQKIKENEIVMFAAVGTLRTSSLQRGTGTLYRLTDPATGRTICYLRTADAKYATLLGQFIGVRGTISTEAGLNMKMIDTPTEPQAVNPAKVNTAISAQIIPPSLMPGVRSASTSTPE